MQLHVIQSRLKLQLIRLKQSDSFEKYVSKFKSIVNRIDHITDEDTLLLFTEGLQPKTHLEVLNKRCSSLEEAIIFASNAESCLSRPIEINFLNSKKPNHYRKFQGNQAQKPQRFQKPLAQNQIRCFNCKKLGHLSKNCFKKKDDKGGNRKAWKPKTIAVCRSNAYSLLMVQAQVKKNPIWCAIDSGALESVLSYRVAKELVIVVVQSSKRIKSVNNQVTDVVGETENVEIDSENYKTVMSFIVIDLEDYDILLGLDWLRSERVSIDY